MPVNKERQKINNLSRRNSAYFRESHNLSTEVGVLEGWIARKSPDKGSDVIVIDRRKTMMSGETDHRGTEFRCHSGMVGGRGWHGKQN